MKQAKEVVADNYEQNLNILFTGNRQRASISVALYRIKKYMIL